MSKASAVLGLGEVPSVREVKEAFRSLSLIHHPDVGGDALKFQIIHDAYLIALGEAEDRPCENCKGKKTIVVQRGWNSVRVTCPECNGIGYLS